MGVKALMAGRAIVSSVIDSFMMMILREMNVQWTIFRNYDRSEWLYAAAGFRFAG